MGLTLQNFLTLYQIWHKTCEAPDGSVPIFLSIFVGTYGRLTLIQTNKLHANYLRRIKRKYEEINLYKPYFQKMCLTMSY